MRHFLVFPLSRRNRCRLIPLLAAVISTLIFLLFISTSNVEPSDALAFASHFGRRRDRGEEEEKAAKAAPSLFAEPSDALTFASYLPGRPDQGEEEEAAAAKEEVLVLDGHSDRASCVSVEKMGEAFARSSEEESLRVREVIERHFDLNGAARVRELPAHQFCRHGFVIGKASEAGFGNEMYKILTAAALSVMLNRSLIIGQTRSLYPFGDYVSYTNRSFSLQEVKHLWRKHDCAGTHRRKLIVRVDNFEQPQYTNVLCSNWKEWKHPIVWFQGTNDAVAIQFFLKNVHPLMKSAASVLFGLEQPFKSRPNVFGELMRAILSPTPAIEEAIDWVLQGVNPDVVLHMRMMSNRSVRAMEAAVQCIKRAVSNLLHRGAKPRVLLVSDTPSFVKEITPYLTEFSQVVHFNYKNFHWNRSTGSMKMQQQPDFRVKDWGPAPRWVALVDFFLASRAKHAVVSGAHRRVGTTYAQLIAALAAANQHGKDPFGTNFSFLSSFHSNLLVDGLRSQIGWGHIWHRFAGPMSCRHQSHQCALTPLLPPAWWDGEWQSPTSRDIEKLKQFGVRLTESGAVSESHLQAFCRSKEDHVKTLKILGQF